MQLATGLNPTGTDSVGRGTGDLNPTVTDSVGRGTRDLTHTGIDSVGRGYWTCGFLGP